MKNILIFIGCFITVCCILLLGLLAASADNWVIGVFTGISLCEFPRWVKYNLKHNGNE